MRFDECQSGSTPPPPPEVVLGRFRLEEGDLLRRGGYTRRKTQRESVNPYFGPLGKVERSKGLGNLGLWEWRGPSRRKYCH